MAKKTVRLSTNTGDIFAEVPCSMNLTEGTALKTLDGLTIISEQEHLANVTPCLNAQVLRIFCD